LAYELTVINPSGNATRMPLDILPFSIGRHSENQLVLRDSRVSRRHAQIVDGPQGLEIEDLESLHGVRVNREKVARQRLAVGDEIDFGLEDGYRLIVGEKSEAEIRKLLGRLPGAEAQKGGELSRLRALTEVARSLEHALSTEEVLAAVIEGALTVTGMQRGFLLLEANKVLAVRVGRDSTGKKLTAEDLPVPAALVQRALKERKDLLSLQFDPLSDWSGRFNDSLDGLDLRTVLCVPIIRLRGGAGAGETMAATLDDTIGVLYLDSRVGAVSTEEGSRELLQTLALEASSILENARLLEEERARQRLEKELELARTIQESLLPRQLPSQGFLAVAGSSIPTHQVGGDFYDVIPRPGGGYLATVADVSGKGVAAALLASLLQGVLMEAAAAGTPMREWLPRLNRFLLERTEGEKYCTIFACEVEPDGLLRFANAGHSRPFLVRPNGTSGPAISVLESNGFAVGMLDIARYEVEEVQLSPGDTLVLFSDGVEEARRGPKEFFGRERIASSLAANASAPLEVMHSGLRGALTEYMSGHEPHDDATILMLRYS
jgi:serine phosphatase RsbU (regulator of sigma subunit)/pSer/pThr/pTyr-binding forkhead associated (FHA) protein